MHGYTNRFKIDHNDYPSEFTPFALYRLVVDTGWFGRPRENWVMVGSFETIAAARAHYEKLKTLPEYLV